MPWMVWDEALQRYRDMSNKEVTRRLAHDPVFQAQVKQYEDARLKFLLDMDAEYRLFHGDDPVSVDG